MMPPDTLRGQVRPDHLTIPAKPQFREGQHSHHVVYTWVPGKVFDREADGDLVWLGDHWKQQGEKNATRR